MLVANIAFASAIASDAEYFDQASIGPSPENFPALNGDVYHGSADGALTMSNFLDNSAVNLGSTPLLAQIEDEILEDQCQIFKYTRCGGEESVCCLGDRTYSNSRTAWPCSSSRHHRISPTFSIPYLIDTSIFNIERYVRGAGNENVGWFFDSHWTNYSHAPKKNSACE